MKTLVLVMAFLISSSVSADDSQIALAHSKSGKVAISVRSSSTRTELSNIHLK